VGVGDNVAVGAVGVETGAGALVLLASAGAEVVCELGGIGVGMTICGMGTAVGAALFVVGAGVGALVFAADGVRCAFGCRVPCANGVRCAPGAPALFAAAGVLDDAEGCAVLLPSQAASALMRINIIKIAMKRVFMENLSNLRMAYHLSSMRRQYAICH
jgi:hypothetical protein